MEKMQNQVELDQEMITKMEFQCNQIRDENIEYKEQLILQETEIKNIKSKYQDLKNSKKELEANIDSLLKQSDEQLRECQLQLTHEREIVSDLQQSLTKEKSRSLSIEKELTQLQLQWDQIVQENSFLLQEIR